MAFEILNMFMCVVCVCNEQNKVCRGYLSICMCGGVVSYAYCRDFHQMVIVSFCGTYTNIPNTISLLFSNSNHWENSLPQPVIRTHTHTHNPAKYSRVLDWMKKITHFSRSIFRIAFVSMVCVFFPQTIDRNHDSCRLRPHHPLSPVLVPCCRRGFVKCIRGMTWQIHADCSAKIDENMQYVQCACKACMHSLVRVWVCAVTFCYSTYWIVICCLWNSNRCHIFRDGVYVERSGYNRERHTRHD